MKLNNWLFLLPLLILFPSFGQAIDTLKLTSQTLVIDEEKLDGMLCSIDSYQNELVVGIPWEDNGRLGLDTNNVATGAAIIYNIDEKGELQQLQHLRADDGQPFDRFGESVAISEKYLAIGAPGKVGNSIISVGNGPGAIYLYEKKNEHWESIQKLTFPDTLVHLRFGGEVALYGDFLLTSVFLPTSTEGISTIEGVVVLFKRNANGVWSLTQQVSVPPIFKRTIFGKDIVVDNGQVMISTHPAILLDHEEKPDLSGGVLYYQLDTIQGALQYIHHLSSDYSSSRKKGYFGQAMALKRGELLVLESSERAIYKYNYSIDTGWDLERKFQMPQKQMSIRKTNQLVFGEHHIIAGNSRLLQGTTLYMLRAQGDENYSWEVDNLQKLPAEDDWYIQIHDMEIIDNYLIVVQEDRTSMDSSESYNWLRVYSLE